MTVHASEKNNGKARQFMVAVILNLASISLGMNSGWTSPTAPLLRSPHPPVGDAPLTEQQIAWIASVSEIGGLLTIPLCARVCDRVGRKSFAAWCALPHIVSWLLIVLARSHVHLYAAKLVHGAATSMTFFIVPLYVSEIATEDARGLLGSLLMLAMNVGVLLAYLGGAYLPYRRFVELCLVTPIAFVLAMLLVPETPVHLVRCNRQSQARRSLMFYRGDNREMVERELVEMRAQLKTTDNVSRKAVSLREFFGDRAARRGLVVSFGLITAQAFSGATAMTPYAETIFKLADVSISAELASIILAVIQTVGSQLSTMTMERAGRRLLSLISCLGMAVCLGAVGMFFHLQGNGYHVDSISWLPLLGLSGYVIAFCLGMGPVPFVILAELFRLDFTSSASMMSFVFLFVINFVSINLFSLAMRYCGSDGTFFILSLCCLVSFVFCYCLLPETKGRKREDIVDELAGVDKPCRDRTTEADESTASQLLDNSESVL